MSPPVSDRVAYTTCYMCVCPYGAREYDVVDGVMKKCTLCIDRIYNENLEEVDRVPACVATCPVSARHFGDFADPDSAVSRMTAERGGHDLMTEQDCQPTNKYLPPRPRRDSAAVDGAPSANGAPPGSAGRACWRSRPSGRPACSPTVG